MIADIGIGAVHCVLPNDKVKVEDLPEFGTLPPVEADFVRKSGVATVGVFPDASVVALAASAVRELFVEYVGEPDLLLLVGSRAPDVLIGSDAGGVQTDAGVPSAFAFAIDGLGCTGSSAAWALARDLLIADPAKKAAVIAYASRPAGPDRVRFPVTVIGDGAYAMTIVRGGRPVLRAHRMETDGSFHDLFAIDYKKAPWYEWREVCSLPDRYRMELALHSRLRLSRMVDAVLAEAGIGIGDVAATLMQNVTASAFEFYENLLGAQIHPVCRRHLAAYGHLGAMDVVLNLHRLTTDGGLRRGDHILVLNSSPTAAWSVTLWEA